MARTTLCLAAFFLLSACGNGQEVTEYQVRSAGSGLRVGLSLLQDRSEEKLTIPLSHLLLRIGALLSKTESVAALPSSLRERKTEGETEFVQDAELLQRLIELMRIDLREQLNASSDRTETLDEYMHTLTDDLQHGETRLRALRDRETNLRDDQDRLKRGVADLRDELDTAIRGGEGKSVAALSADLTERQQALAEAETSLVVVQRSLDALNRVLPSLQERIHAVQANREALLKGVRVTDIPGVDALGIIVLEDGKPRIRNRR